MNGFGEKRVCRNLSGDDGRVDRLRNLPDSLLYKILLDLPTKDVVKTSALSSEWRNLWKCVPGLDLEYVDFPRYNSFVSFVDSFLGFDSESCLESFRLRYRSDHDCDEPEIERWINTVVKRRVENISVFEDRRDDDYVQIPSSIYTCESLVLLELCCVILAKPPETVSLWSLKVMDLNEVTFIDGSAFEEMLSGCPVLKRLSIKRRPMDHIDVLRVCSQSLVSFTFVSETAQYFCEEILVVTVDTPRLEFLKLKDNRPVSFVIQNVDSLVEVDIDIVFDPNDVPKRNMIHDFLGSLSSVENMVISSKTLKVICDYSKWKPLPLFHNLSFLCVEFCNYRWEMLPIFLQSCTNLKTLVVGSTTYLKKEGIRILYGSQCLLSSLEYVLIERPFKGEMMEMKLVSFLLENSTNLKKLVVCLDDSKKKNKSTILKRLRTIPRLSRWCQIVTL